MHTTIRTITAAALAGALALSGTTPANAADTQAAVAAHDDEIILNSLTTLEETDADGVEYGAGLPDTDGDGIPDIWEQDGVILIDGTEVPLADMGADPNRPDLFLQLNWMASEYETLNCDQPERAASAECATANTKTYRPDAQMLQDLVDLFDDHGIALHIDAGETFTNIPGYAETYGGQTESYTQYAFGGSAPATALLANQDRLLGERANIFRLGVIGDQMNPGNRSSGTAVVNGSSFYVANIMNSQTQLRNTILHEFGHTLGLGHYGAKTATADIKNNERMQADYLSVMNYNHQFTHFNYSETPYTYTGAYGTRVVPADWDALELANDWIGFEAAATGVTADPSAVAAAEATRAAAQAAANPVALEGETAHQLRQVVTAAKAELAKAELATVEAETTADTPAETKAETAEAETKTETKADTKVEAKAEAVKVEQATTAAGNNINIAAIIGPIVAILALLGIGAGAAFAL